MNGRTIECLGKSYEVVRRLQSKRKLVDLVEDGSGRSLVLKHVTRRNAGAVQRVMECYNLRPWDPCVMQVPVCGDDRYHLYSYAPGETVFSEWYKIWNDGSKCAKFVDALGEYGLSQWAFLTDQDGSAGNEFGPNPFVHLDFNPNNIVLNKAGGFTTIDVASLRTFDDAWELRKEGSRFGTKPYATPDQYMPNGYGGEYDDSNIDLLVDLYSLMTTLAYFLVVNFNLRHDLLTYRIEELVTHTKHFDEEAVDIIKKWLPLMKCVIRRYPKVRTLVECRQILNSHNITEI